MYETLMNRKAESCCIALCLRIYNFRVQGLQSKTATGKSSGLELYKKVLMNSRIVCLTRGKKGGTDSFPSFDLVLVFISHRSRQGSTRHHHQTLRLAVSEPVPSDEANR